MAHQTYLVICRAIAQVEEVWRVIAESPEAAHQQFVDNDIRGQYLHDRVVGDVENRVPTEIYLDLGEPSCLPGLPGQITLEEFQAGCIRLADALDAANGGTVPVLETPEPDGSVRFAQPEMTVRPGAMRRVADVLNSKQGSAEGAKEAPSAVVSEVTKEGDGGGASFPDLSASHARAPVNDSALIARLGLALQRVSDLAKWMSGSPSFGPEGVAHEGWLKQRGILDDAQVALDELKAWCAPDAESAAIQMDQKRAIDLAIRGGGRLFRWPAGVWTYGGCPMVGADQMPREWVSDRIVQELLKSGILRNSGPDASLPYVDLVVDAVP